MPKLALCRRLKRLRALVCMGALCGLPDTSGCPGGSVLIKSYGYLEVRPPSRLFEPGAMIVILHQSPLEAAIVCGPRGSLGPQHQAQRSRTVGQALSKLNKTTFNMEANYLEAIRGDARFNKIHRIVMEIDNARVEEVRDEQVVIGRRRRSRECTECIENRVAAGFKPVMVSSVLSGDMRFHIEWSKEAHISAKAKVDTLSQLAVELGGGVESVTESTITASNLVFGIRYSRYLAALSMPEESGSVNLDEPPVSRRDMGPEAARSASIRIDPVPDAPVLMPEGVDPTDITWVDDGNVRRFNMPLPTLPEGAPIFAPARPISRESVARRRATLDPRESADARARVRPD